MSDTNAVLNEVLLKALNAVEKGGDFVVEQAPDVVQQLLTRTLVTSCIWALLGAIGTVVGYKMIKYAFDNEYSEAGSACAVGGGILLSFSFGCLLINTLTALKVWLAPKIFLIEYAASLVK